MIGFGQQTYVPDDNFEQALINFGYDNVLDDYVTTANINTIVSLFVHLQNISDLTGIEGFSALQNLHCHGNQLISLDVSSNTALTVLFCHSNQLTDLDLSNNTVLGSLSCYDNPLTSLNISTAIALTELRCWNSLLASLDVSNNLSLEFLACLNNQLISLDVSQNTALRELYCHNNQLTNLDIGNNTTLDTLKCSGNQLTTLDVSGATALAKLKCSGNQLTSLDLRNGNNTNIIYLKCADNPNLSCINVDDSTYSTSNWIGVDFEFNSQHYFSNNCSGTTDIEEYTTNKELLKVTDLLGRETKGKKNEPLFYIYDDGTVDKQIIIE